MQVQSENKKIMLCKTWVDICLFLCPFKTADLFCCLQLDTSCVSIFTVSVEFYGRAWCWHCVFYNLHMVWCWWKMVYSAQPLHVSHSSIASTSFPIKIPCIAHFRARSHCWHRIVPRKSSNVNAYPWTIKYLSLFNHQDLDESLFLLNSVNETWRQGLLHVAHTDDLHKYVAHKDDLQNFISTADY